MTALRIIGLINAALLALIIALQILTLVNTATVVDVQLSDATMHVNPACAEVIRNSGATTAIEVHRNVTGTPEYIKACF